MQREKLPPLPAGCELAGLTRNLNFSFLNIILRLRKSYHYYIYFSDIKKVSQTDTLHLHRMGDLLALKFRVCVTFLIIFLLIKNLTIEKS